MVEEVASYLENEGYEKDTHLHQLNMERRNQLKILNGMVKEYRELRKHGNFNLGGIRNRIVIRKRYLDLLQKFINKER
jgi:hypothetical protein